MTLFNKITRSMLVVFVALTMSRCSDKESTDQFPFVKLKQGIVYTQDGASVPVGGQMKFGISAVGGGAAITNIRIKRILEQESIVELDRGVYIATGGIDTTFAYVKSAAEQETWNFFIMNANRDTASISLTVYKGDGSAYGDILFFPSITIGFPANDQYGHFLDLNSGTAYSEGDVAGHEQDIDLASYFYFSSGVSSPTLTCPAYPSALTYYPMFAGWTVKNSTLYDYYTCDNDLIPAVQFDAAENDSLLVVSYKPQNVSGSCKFCYTGKIIPFKTSAGKYGMVKVIRADEQEGGSMEIAVKIQE